VLAVGLGAFAAYWVYLARQGLGARLAQGAGWLYDVLDNAYYVDRAYQEAIVRPLRAAARGLAEGVEVGSDRAVDGLAALVARAGAGIRRLQTGLVRNYALAMLVGAVLIVAYFLLRSLLGG
jgi:NADH-quinone oxidoreductase subunit L